MFQKEPFQSICLFIGCFKKSNQTFPYLQNGQEILDNLADLKPGIADRYEEWCLAQMDGADGYSTPILPTQVRFKRPFQFICLYVLKI